MSQDRQIKAVRFGWDMGSPGGDRTAYYCSTHGHMTEPCACIDAYAKSQQRNREVVRQSETDSLEHDMRMAEAGWARK